MSKWEVPPTFEMPEGARFNDDGDIVLKGGRILTVGASQSAHDLLTDDEDEQHLATAADEYDPVYWDESRAEYFADDEEPGGRSVPMLDPLKAYAAEAVRMSAVGPRHRVTSDDLDRC